MQPLLSPKRTTLSAWSDPVSDSEAHRRAGGRARYNLDCQLDAMLLRPLVVRRYIELNAAYGAKAQIGREFHLHRSTVGRYIRQWSGEEMSLCPTCFSPVCIGDWNLLTEARKEQHVENPLSDAANARRAAAKAIREELPRVRADLHVFINDPDDEDPDDPAPRAVYLRSPILDAMVQRLAEHIKAA